jgi:hypothetical protein
MVEMEFEFEDLFDVRRARRLLTEPRRIVIAETERSKSRLTEVEKKSRQPGRIQLGVTWSSSDKR